MFKPEKIGFLSHKQPSKKYVVLSLPKLKKPKITFCILQTSVNNSKENVHFYFSQLGDIAEWETIQDSISLFLPPALIFISPVVWNSTQDLGFLRCLYFIEYQVGRGILQELSSALCNKNFQVISGVTFFSFKFMNPWNIILFPYLRQQRQKL